MNAILGFAQLLEMSHREPLTTGQKERVRQIIKGGQHLLDLINEILDISRIEANRLHISPEPVSVRESIREVFDLTVPLAVKRQIQLVAKLGKMDIDPFVLADRQRFKQVLLNLVGNAVKYSYDGGSIIVTCQQMPSNQWRISIMDTGPGIAQENLTRLFRPFERLDAGASYVEGTGLGLVVAKRLIELMQGHIGVESRLGRGSTFWIELPIAERPVENLERTGGTKELPPLSVNAQTILYVEDNIANFELIQQVLVDYRQIELLWAADAKSGVEMAQFHIPNLILLDLHLGNTDGTEVLYQLKKAEKTKNIPVIVVTADATAGQNTRLIQMGANAHLTKPINVKQLMILMEELLSQKEF
jgi:CheY-like chemotaxis protein